MFLFISAELANAGRCVLNRTSRGKDAMWPRCLSTIAFTWSVATTVGRGSALWSAWTTQQMRTVFGTPSPPWMCVVASRGPRHSEVRKFLCQMTHPFNDAALLWKLFTFVPTYFTFNRHDLCCWWLRWQPASYQHGTIWSKYWPVEHAGRYANSQRGRWFGCGKWTYILSRYGEKAC